MHLHYRKSPYLTWCTTSHWENKCLVCLIMNGKCGTPVFWIQCRRYCLQRSCAAIFGFVFEPDKCDCSFQQDTATCHTANETMNILRHFFGDHLISRNIWPPHYPELTLPDFFLWGHLKERAYNDNPHILNDVKKAILQALNNITPTVLRHMLHNMHNHV
jgi:hypothetical protein